MLQDNLSSIISAYSTIAYNTLIIFLYEEGNTTYDFDPDYKYYRFQPCIWCVFLKTINKGTLHEICDSRGRGYV